MIMRDATKEELESVQKYIDSISIKTGINFYELIERYNKLPIKFNDLGYNECPTCGFSVETDDIYCRNCGQEIKLEIED